MLQRIVEAAAALVDARYGALGVLSPERDTLAAVHHRRHRRRRRSARSATCPRATASSACSSSTPKPLRLPDLARAPRQLRLPARTTRRCARSSACRSGSADEVFGNLYLTDKPSAEVFTDVDEELVVGLAAAAGVAIENARLHASVRELALVEDRERIARDLHDTVIQRLFATGLSLQATSRVLDRPAASPSGSATRSTTSTPPSAQIRSTIFALSRRRPRPRRWPQSGAGGRRQRGAGPRCSNPSCSSTGACRARGGLGVGDELSLRAGTALQRRPHRGRGTSTCWSPWTATSWCG